MSFIDRALRDGKTRFGGTVSASLVTPALFAANDANDAGANVAAALVAVAAWDVGDD